MIIKTDKAFRMMFVIFVAAFCLAGCIFPAAWYDPGINLRITATAFNDKDIAEIEKIITEHKYDFISQRSETYMKKDVIIKDYQKEVIPSRKDTPPNVHIMFVIEQNELRLNIQTMYGRKDMSIETEIDTVGGVLYRELVKRLGEGKVTKKLLTYGPPII